MQMLRWVTDGVFECSRARASKQWTKLLDLNAHGLLKPSEVPSGVGSGKKEKNKTLCMRLHVATYSITFPAFVH